MDDICIHNFARSTCYYCSGEHLRDRAQRMSRSHRPPQRDFEHREGRSGKNGIPVEQPPDGTVNIYPESEASFRKLNGMTEHVRIIGMPLGKVIDRILKLAPNVRKIYVGVRLELVGAKIQIRLARRKIVLIGSSR